MLKLYECSLPFPVSVNSAYGNRSNQQRFKSKSYKAWLQRCPLLTLPECGSIDFPVHLNYAYFMPDKRLRDIGNYEKLVTDFLVSQGVLFDDATSIIQSLHLNFAGIDRGSPRVEIGVFKIKPDNIVRIT